MIGFQPWKILSEEQHKIFSLERTLGETLCVWNHSAQIEILDVLYKSDIQHCCVHVFQKLKLSFQKPCDILEHY